MPNQRKCPKCGGTGRDLFRGWLSCSRCGGDGYIGPKEVDCPRCHGSGESIPEGFGNTQFRCCEKCFGTGRIWIEI